MRPGTSLPPGGLSLTVRLVAVLFALVTAFAWPALGASPRTEQAEYFLGEGVVTNACFTDPEGWLGTGGACFALDGSETTVDVTVRDDSGLPVFVSTLFWDAQGTNVAGVWRCDGTDGVVVIPEGTVVVEVDVDDPVWNTESSLVTTGTASCLPGGPGTTGTITATFGDAPRPPPPPVTGHCRSGVGFIGRDASSPGVGVDFGVLGCGTVGEDPDTRWIAPGSDVVSLRHFMDHGIATLQGHVSGLGADADVTLHRVVSEAGIVTYESDDVPVDDALEGDIVGTVLLPGGGVATDTYRTFDALG